MQIIIFHPLFQTAFIIFGLIFPLLLALRATHLWTEVQMDLEHMEFIFSLLLLKHYHNISWQNVSFTMEFILLIKGKFEIG